MIRHFPPVRTVVFYEDEDLIFAFTHRGERVGADRVDSRPKTGAASETDVVSVACSITPMTRFFVHRASSPHATTSLCIKRREVSKEDFFRHFNLPAIC